MHSGCWSGNLAGVFRRSRSPAASGWKYSRAAGRGNTAFGLTVNALFLALRVPANRIGGIVKGQRRITGDTSLRLARYFGTSAQMWMNLEAKYDLAIAEDASAARIMMEVRPRAAA